eukprot:gnl/TRDRNA2_/TRDRNA2_193378_c0_seq1.p1 gnl/TRDRNA2_/TRDRNA2_193378_c0~~gnl/TRDRNA2_/TRDRNA2_193378_c0_seq1.p1  ORF type:complete len:281 (-),score=39.23 gnl/TRDRNA2_/TRDRNA2_193378_c0_seq1:113-955(-)
MVAGAEELVYASSSDGIYIDGKEMQKPVLKSQSAPELSASLIQRGPRKGSAEARLLYGWGPLGRGSGPRGKPRGPGCAGSSLPATPKAGRDEMRQRRAQHTQAWDDGFWKTQCQNELLPKRLKSYFSKPQTLDELKADLLSRPDTRPFRANLRKIDDPMWKEKPEHLDTVPVKPSPITADSGPPACPERHSGYHGHMVDRDGYDRPWDNRWHAGVHIMNEGMHPLHRKYFSQASLFEDAPSQEWRRYNHQEVDAGKWIPTKQTRPHRFGPLGAKMCTDER